MKTAEEIGRLLEREDHRKTLVNYWFETMGGGWVRPDWTAIAQAVMDFLDIDPAEVERLRAIEGRARHCEETARPGEDAMRTTAAYILRGAHP